jgi:phage major head subunit gpT-like protein
LSEAALEQACIDIAGFTNDRGLLIAVRPKSLIIPRQLMFEAKRILGTDGRVGTE